MSQEYSTALKLGATAPFTIIMALPIDERASFIEMVTPTLSPAFKRAALKGA
jgi:hypothetical protein